LAVATNEELQVFTDLPLVSCLKKFVENTFEQDNERKALVEKICTGYHL